MDWLVKVHLFQILFAQVLSESYMYILLSFSFTIFLLLTVSKMLIEKLEQLVK